MNRSSWICNSILALLLTLVVLSLSPTMAAQVGVWQFNDNLNNDQPGGAAMSAVGGWTPTYVNESIGGSPATVLSFPAFTALQALDMPNEAGPNGGSLTTTNVWSIVMDVKFPLLNPDNFTALWDAQTLGTTDGDYWIRDDSINGTFGSIGTSGQYAGDFNADTWTRIAVTIDPFEFGTTYALRGYIDGSYTRRSESSSPPDGKMAVEAFLHLFADAGLVNQSVAGLVNSVAFYDEVLTVEAIGLLGGASAAGIPAEIPPGVLGDYNQNGVVDAADYTKWRDNLGAAIALPNEGVTPGMVTPEDYSFWKTNFGNSEAGSGAGFGAAAVPEPAGCCMVIVALLGAAGMSPGRRTHPADPICS